MTTIENQSKSKQMVEKIEGKVGNTFPRVKATMGGFWTIIWIIIAFVVETIVVLIPIILAIAGVIFLIALIVASDGSFDVPVIFWGSNKKEEDE